jgi:atypical dual specificity phosphatase
VHTEKPHRGVAVLDIEKKKQYLSSISSECGEALQRVDSRSDATAQHRLLLRSFMSTLLAFKREATQIVPNLYLTDFLTACSESTLSELGITHVISVIRFPVTFFEKFTTLHHLRIPLEDDHDADLFSHLDTTTKFIGDALAGGGRVLVHCLKGISRSASVVIAYVMYSMAMTSEEATSFVKSKRGIVCPNRSFAQQLERYSVGLFKDRYRGNARKKAVSDSLRARMESFKAAASEGSVVTTAVDTNQQS